MVYLDLSIVSIVTESCGEIKYNQTGTKARGQNTRTEGCGTLTALCLLLKTFRDNQLRTSQNVAPTQWNRSTKKCSNVRGGSKDLSSFVLDFRTNNRIVYIFQFTFLFLDFLNNIF